MEENCLARKGSFALVPPTTRDRQARLISVSSSRGGGFVAWPPSVVRQRPVRPARPRKRQKTFVNIVMYFITLRSERVIQKLSTCGHMDT